MSKQDVLIAVVGGTHCVQEIIREAARRAFSSVNIGCFAGLPEASQALATARNGVLISVEPASPETGREPVLRMGAVAGREEAFAPEEWTVPLLARAMEFTVREQALATDLARARGDLLTLGRRIVHDLRTPLGGVLTSVEVLREILVEKDVPCLDLTDAVSHSANDLGRILDRVSFLAKASASPVSTTSFRMEEAVGNVLERLKPKMKEKGAFISVPEQWPVVQGVPLWCEVIWQNLILNALQHGPPAPRITLGWEQEGDDYRFRVEDNGSGVPVERRSLLFQSFDELHQPKSARGLGLSIVRRLTELQGGLCRYEAPSEGRHAFTFTLPGAASQYIH